ncbi:MAG TPA: transcription antitermination factor NusB [Vicinamibacterales bacterium]|nr:transcription antitermination factor NusB [Vicinamibacterales bacterium]
MDPRHQAREAALQMLYQWEVGRLSMLEVRQTFWSAGHDSAATAPQAVRDLATRLADGVAAEIDRLDPMIVEAAEHWRLERMNVVDRLILRLATYEMLHETDTPAKVVINEALELARAFSGDEAVRFINGVLDAIRRTLQRA